ncbi:MAG: ATP-binding cassette domain-containing protein, partial [Acidimicrobiia bacterium]|nr:ATP-binding cassette domain-containing protein [Acidimicrobiia bacterium]
GTRAATQLEMAEFLDRWVNQGLSGGEKKRSEIVQLLAREPKMALLDEIDSGLDIDAVREVAAAVEGLRHPERGVLIITHYSRILRYLTVDKVHIMISGRVVRSGGSELAEELESKGYDVLRGELGLESVDASDPFP